MFLEGDQTSTESNQEALFPEGVQTNTKHCFVAMFPESWQTSKLGQQGNILFS
jgi:hypothetical protein